MKNSAKALLSALLVGSLLTACGEAPAPEAKAPAPAKEQAAKEPAKEAPATETAATEGQYQEKTTGLANPGADFCIKLGGEYKIVEGADGQRGECHLPDGRVEDAMALYRGHATAAADKMATDAKDAVAAIGMANPAAEYCVKIGGEHKVVKEEAGEVGYCHLKDGQVVNAWDYFRAHHQQQ
ncbi:DUF333 domain-containing protein [Shewanella sp. 3B26]|jgi:putative hemolysin|uniref:DUF333 domain-containing protein n=1 Tax=Shewanella zhuhaiensis TaxID=2919576 RepID=A0AAJ1EZG8_9GAMM|nr:DUF333 domain-containing protein [Shewanella zhuhaiensis]MCH4293497.1 DUF333 domain-containing protein [Shewanella zhuhaiensis]